MCGQIGHLAAVHQLINILASDKLEGRPVNVRLGGMPDLLIQFARQQEEQVQNSLVRSAGFEQGFKLFGLVVRVRIILPPISAAHEGQDRQQAS